jgi:hypothetical protein
MEDSNADQPCPAVASAVACRHDHPAAYGCKLCPASDQASVAIPPTPSQQARVWFYREVDTAAENTTTPYVRLNGAIADVPVQGGAFYRDVPPGRYQITVDSQGMSPSPSRDVALVAGEQIYVRIGLGASWNSQGFTITVVPSEVGRTAIEHSQFYGGRALSANQRRHDRRRGISCHRTGSSASGTTLTSIGAYCLSVSTANSTRSSVGAWTQMSVSPLRIY